MIDVLLTPPPTRQTTPTSLTPPSKLILSAVKRDDKARKRTTVSKKWPEWVAVSLQVIITLPLYLFAFWLMIEGLKAGGEDLVYLIDYLAFRPSMKRDL